MKSASISELQKELHLIERKQLIELCVRLSKYKKENKEYLNYLLFETPDEKQYINNVKELIDEGFDGLNRKTVYFTKKGLRKVVRIMNKFIKFSDSKQTELELRIYFVKKMKAEHIPIDESLVLSNLYHREIEKVKSTLVKLHEDIQYDYQQEVEQLN
jgi:vacuolar-type H+-ATPase catalytic subunit A/Vma1